MNCERLQDTAKEFAPSKPPGFAGHEEFLNLPPAQLVGGAGVLGRAGVFVASSSSEDITSIGSIGWWPRKPPIDFSPWGRTQ